MISASDLEIFTEKFYGEICLNQTSEGPAFVFGIDRYSVYTNYLTKISYTGNTI